MKLTPLGNMSAGLWELPLIGGKQSEILTPTNAAREFGLYSFTRKGNFTYEVYQGTGGLPIDTTGPVALTHWNFFGSELSQVKSQTQIMQAVTSTEVKGDPQGWAHYDNRQRTAPDFELPVQYQGCHIIGGRADSMSTTGAACTLHCVTTDFFRYGGSLDNQYYAAWIVPTTWASYSPELPRTLGDFFLTVTNDSRGELLLVVKDITMGQPPKSLIVFPIEGAINLWAKDKVATNDKIVVSLTHHFEARVQGDENQQLIGGAASGFALIPTKLKN